MDIADIRRKNLQACLVKVFDGNQSRLAEKIQRPPRSVNGMLHGKKSFGERVARDIEQLLGLPRGALDAPISDGDLRAKVTALPSRGNWPFDVARERFDALSETGKLKVEGALLAVIRELEEPGVASAKKRSGKRRAT
jgi:hypothetical protein